MAFDESRSRGVEESSEAPDARSTRRQGVRHVVAHVADIPPGERGSTTAFTVSFGATWRGADFVTSRARPGSAMNFGRIRFGGNPLAVFANALSPLAQRVVVDRTDLAGNWEFELTFTPDQTQLPPGAPPGVQLPNVDPNGASLFTALEEQLGLKLQATRGPVEVLVIDRVEQPTGN